MGNQFIRLFGDILSGKEPPKRICCVEYPTESDAGFIVDSGHSLSLRTECKGKEPFLDSHPELWEILSRMQVGDVAEREDTTNGPLWRIKDQNGVVRETIPLVGE